MVPIGRETNPLVSRNSEMSEVEDIAREMEARAKASEEDPPEPIAGPEGRKIKEDTYNRDEGQSKGGGLMSLRKQVREQENKLAKMASKINQQRQEVGCLLYTSPSPRDA